MSSESDFPVLYTTVLVHTTDVSHVCFWLRKNIHVKNINCKYFNTLQISTLK